METKNCTKVAFDTMKQAIERQRELNKQNPSKNSKSVKMRAYECPKCKKFHLTSLSNQQYKYKSDTKYREAKRREDFIKKESNYWNKKFGIEED